MIDAYIIGINLVLENGVSVGVATIRRDLIALNGVVEGSGMRLKHLTRAAAALQIGPGIADSNNKGSTAPMRGHSERAITAPSGSPSSDPGLSAPRRLDLLTVAKALVPMFSPPTAQSIAGIGLISAGSPGMMSSETPPIVPDFRASAPVISREWHQGAMLADFAPVRYPLKTLSAASTYAAPADGSAHRFLMGTDDVPPPSAIANGASPRSPPGEPNISVSLVGNSVSPHPLQQPTGGVQMDPSQAVRAAPYDTTGQAHPPSIDPTLQSAVPPPSEPPSAALQGDVYVDGSRLGRWMTDRLVTAAELPRAATTGFDPRMTPTWPGAPLSA
jgi:hypothetical protein